MMTVPLGGKKAAGRVALVDDDDYELVMAHRWSVLERPHSGPYAQTGITVATNRRRILLMHTLITGWRLTDHINHDGLDNQRHNLRSATKSQNGANSLPRPGCTSSFKGVSWDRRGSFWRAQITVDQYMRFLGRFPSEEQAARAYDAAAIRAFGEYALLNFPLPASYQVGSGLPPEEA